MTPMEGTTGDSSNFDPLKVSAKAIESQIVESSFGSKQLLCLFGLSATRPATDLIWSFFQSRSADWEVLSQGWRSNEHAFARSGFVDRFPQDYLYTAFQQQVWVFRLLFNSRSIPHARPGNSQRALMSCFLPDLRPSTLESFASFCHLLISYQTCT